MRALSILPFLALAACNDGPTRPKAPSLDGNIACEDLTCGPGQICVNDCLPFSTCDLGFASDGGFGCIQPPHFCFTVPSACLSDYTCACLGVNGNGICEAPVIVGRGVDLTHCI